jgi:RHS repeat-associated protein
VDFNGAKAIDEVDVFSVGDYPGLLTQADPSPTQTFTMYAATAFNVEYWNGSGWATVPGGSITNNNLLWRKIQFASITTARIRVTVSAASDGVARIAEVEAWTASSGSSAQLHWLVTDQLGTPRMVFDQSGSLASVSRHDYLPFGEEIGANTGGRTPALGYTNGDGARQKFTSKERDDETGLDYFGARYYANAQGRFTSADDFLLDTHPNDPESWNLYTYVRNNPLTYTDPSGQIIQNTDDRKHRLSKGELKAIRDDLRKKTGLKSINFDKKTGTFSYDKNETAKGGSAELRQQITGAIDDQKNVFKLNDYSGTESLQFADTDAGTVLSNTGVTTYQVRIDFSDFRDAKVLSDKEAIEAFSIGFVLSHEVDHKVSYDPNNPCPLGGRPDDGPYGVIADVNLAESQLGLATRSLGSHTGQPYHGADSRFKNTNQIQFNDASGQARFLRWKLESQR